MDTSPPALIALAAVATLLLALTTAVEAAAVPLSRRRMVDGKVSPSLSHLLRDYVRVRQRLLRAMRAGVTLATALFVAALAVMATPGGDWSIARLLLVALVGLIVVSLVRTGMRVLVLSSPGSWGRRLEGPGRVAEVLLTPAAGLLRAPVHIPLRALGLRGTSEDIDPAEELVRLLEAVEGEDAALVEERRMLRGLLEMSGQTVRELMTPRLDVTALSADASAREAIDLIARTGYSRIPIYEESLDRVVGVVYAKDLLAYVAPGQVMPRLRDIARPPYLVPDSKRADELLSDMRRSQVHLAIAVDEYGGTAGVVTVEDLLEEIVGAIVDEYDVPEAPFERVSDDVVVVDASLTIGELNELFGTEIESDDFDTVGGLIATELGRLAVPGDEVTVPDDAAREAGGAGVTLHVLSILGRRIKQVRAARWTPDDEERASV
ncbi:MAG: HlyC/CorC family transporter [Dehalococcoidia bacterium]|nr:MAG: HlyC/CorC family transporter [Dehalococcoidia bacterium]